MDELGRDNIRSAANWRVEVLFFDAKDSPDLDAALDASPIYLPGTFVHEPQPFDPATLEVPPIEAVRLIQIMSNRACDRASRTVRAAFWLRSLR